MAARGWILTLRRAGETDGPELELTNAEMQQIADNVNGSCLDTETDLMWLFREAGMDLPKEEILVDFYINADSQSEAVGAVHDALVAAGLDFHTLEAHD